MSPLRNFSLILMASKLVLCEQMDWGDNLNLVEESDTIQGREHIKQLVMLEGDTSNLECQVAFTSHPVSPFRWKVDGKPETKKVTNSSVVDKNGEVFVEEHLVIENITKSMDSSTVSCEYSKGNYGAGVEAILRVFGLDIVIKREVWQSCSGDAWLVFRESNRSSPAEETVDKRIKSKISERTKSDKITVDNSGYSVILPIATVMANEAILAMNPKLIINGTKVRNTLAQCGSEPPAPSKHLEVTTTEAGDIITHRSKTAEIDPKYVDYTSEIEHNHREDIELMDDKNTMNMEHMNNGHKKEIENTETEPSLKNMNLQPEDTGIHGGAADSSQPQTKQLSRLVKELKIRDLMEHSTTEYKEDNWNSLSKEGSKSSLLEENDYSDLPLIILIVFCLLIFIIIVATTVFLNWRSDCGKCRGKGTHECQDSGSEPEDEHLFQIIV